MDIKFKINVNDKAFHKSTIRYGTKKSTNN